VILLSSCKSEAGGGEPEEWFKGNCSSDCFACTQRKPRALSGALAIFSLEEGTEH